jgi:hypothetical protein
MTTTSLVYHRRIDLFEISQLLQVETVLNASFNAAQQISWMEENFSLQLFCNCQSNMLFIMANCYDEKIDDLIRCLKREIKLLDILCKSFTESSGQSGYNFMTVLHNQQSTLKSILLSISAPILVLE